MLRYLKSSMYLSIPLFGLLFIAGCKKKEVYPSETLPSIISLSQTSGLAGTPIVIHGNNLKNVDSVRIGSLPAAGYDPGKNTDTAIHIIVPDSLPVGPTYVQVYFPNGKGYAASAFTVLATPPVPKIDSLSPPSATPGSTITIHGTNFALVNSVSFNGIAATFAHSLDTNGTLTTVVPATAAGGNQFITVSDVYGSDSIAFNVDLKPAITAMSPIAGKVGDTITLTGARFTGATSVTLASASATFKVVSSTTAWFIVPAGAQNGTVSLTTPYGTANAPVGFTVVAPISFYVYQDGLIPNWQISSYTATTTDGTTNPESGTNALYTAYSGGYGAFRISDFNASSTFTPLAGYTTLHISIYAGPGEVVGNKLQLFLNNDYSDVYQITLTAVGQYVDYLIPLSALGSPGSLFEVGLQEYSGDASATIYVDNIGLN